MLRSEAVVHAQSRDIYIQVSGAALRRGEHAVVDAIIRRNTGDSGVEIFGLHRPALRPCPFDAETGDPAHFDRVGRPATGRSCCRLAVRGGVFDLADGDTAGRINQEIVEGPADARTRRAQPVCLYFLTDDVGVA